MDRYFSPYERETIFHGKIKDISFLDDIFANIPEKKVFDLVLRMHPGTILDAFKCIRDDLTFDDSEYWVKLELDDKYIDGFIATCVREMAEELDDDTILWHGKKYKLVDE